MVATAYRSSKKEVITSELKNPLFLPTPLRYGSVSINQVVENGYRLDASAYNIEALKALSSVMHCKYGTIILWGDNGLVNKAFVGGRFKRIYTNNKSDISFFLPSDIENVYPSPSKHISRKTETDIESLRVYKNMLLMSVSGTIGKTSLVGNRLNGQVFSHDLLRITFNGNYDLGYVYAFLNTDVGLTILQSNNYGAVIDHIEPDHLKKVPIPNAPDSVKKEIHELVIKSYDLRDQSNDLINQAQKLLYNELQLPDIAEIKAEYRDEKAGFRNFTIKISELNNRFDASYHIPEVKSIIELISRNAGEVTTIGDKRISKKIVLPGRFKRVYVEKENGTPFFGGKQLLQLNPSNVKYLSISHHGERISSELLLEENMCLITRSGTIGKAMIVPKHWAGWVINEHCLRILPTSDQIAGYIYAWLDSPYCEPLIKRYIYGAVVDEIDDNHLSNVAIPILKNKEIQQKINSLVLDANKLRYLAYLKEQEAIIKMNNILEGNEN